MNTALTTLTETQILEDIRKAFEHETLTDIPVEEMIKSSTTREELMAKIARAIEQRNSKSLS